MHHSSYSKMESFAERHLAGRRGEALTILDLGSADVNGTYRPIFAHPPWIYLGLDMALGENVDIVLRNPYRWREISSCSVDVLVSGQAFEHIQYFWITILEISRVLKTGGLCCIIAPSGGFEHRYPVDCWRFYPDGFAALARFARLEAVEIQTQWNPDHRFTDDSNQWQDSVLVGKKPLLSWKTVLQIRLLSFLLHRLLP